MNKAQANKEAKRIDSLFLPFCPMIKEQCHHECICFRKAVASLKDSDGNYEVRDTYCSNNLFNEEIAVSANMFL